LSILCVVVNPGRLCYVVDGRIFLFLLSLAAPTMCVVGRVCRKGQFEGWGPATTGSLSFVSPSSLRTPGVQISESPVEGLIERCLGSQEFHRNAIMMGKGFAVIRIIDAYFQNRSTYLARFRLCSTANNHAHLCLHGFEWRNLILFLL